MPRTNNFNSTHDELVTKIERLESTQKHILQLLNKILMTLQNKS